MESAYLKYIKMHDYLHDYLLVLKNAVRLITEGLLRKSVQSISILYNYKFYVVLDSIRQNINCYYVVVVVVFSTKRKQEVEICFLFILIFLLFLEYVYVVDIFTNSNIIGILFETIKL